MKRMRGIMTFVRCGDSGSISAAARQLGISPQAASKQLQELEAWVGVRLVNRTSRHLALTHEGAQFHERCKEALASIEDGVRLVRKARTEVAGLVRLAVTPGSMASMLVGPLLARLRERYPKLVVDVVAEYEAHDLVDRRVDVWLYGGASVPNLPNARCIATMRQVLCAAPSYLAAVGEPRSLDDLRLHKWVVVRSGAEADRPHTVRFRTGQPVMRTMHVPVAVSVNDSATALRAVLDGAGIGYFPPLRVLPDIRAGKLQVLEPQVAEDLGVYVCTLSRDDERRGTALADFLHEHLSRNQDLVRGACGRAICRCRTD